MVSHAVEDYLKAIYELAEDSGKVSTSALTEKLGVKPPSVTGMLQKLAETQPPLVDYERHQGVTLTRAGRAVALEVIRHHRLIELYLSRALGYDWDQVDAEAFGPVGICRLEPLCDHRQLAFSGGDGGIALQPAGDVADASARPERLRKREPQFGPRL